MFAKLRFALGIVFPIGAALSPCLAAQTLPPGFRDTVVFSGLTQPTAIAFSSDGRVFVAEKGGRIQVFASLTSTTPSLFADLSTNVYNYWDRGLLGLALDPGFPSKPYVYVLYTYDGNVGGAAPKWGTTGVLSDPCPSPPGATEDGCTVSGRLSRLTASGSVMTGSELVLAHDWFQQYPSHSIGSIAFGPDGYLYASGGDGASFNWADYGQDGNPLNPGGDPPVGVGGTQTPPTAEGGALRSQDLLSSSDPTGLDGAVIRVDPTTGAGVTGNPLFSSSDANARRIVAYGLRNPFRLTFRPGTAELWIGDVGWNTWEEINRLTGVSTLGNFGWPCYEGVGRQASYDSLDLNLCEGLYAQAGAVTAPYYTYNHSAKIVAGETCSTGSSSITGLSFYTGSVYPSGYRNALFFADYSRRCIWVMLPGSGGNPDPANIQTFDAGAGSPVQLVAGPGDDLFYVDINGGAVHRLQYLTPTAVLSAIPTSGSAPLTVAFDATGSTHPIAGEPLTYDWDLNGDGVFGDSTAPKPTWSYSVKGTYTVRLRVTDTHGGFDTASTVINVSNSPPVPTIASPLPTLTWKVGDVISFSGSATDPEDGAIPASRLSWSLLIQHCPSNCHTHSVQDFVGVSSGSFSGQDHEYPSYLVLTLTATDSNGLSASTSVSLQPKTVSLSFDTYPSGLQLSVGSASLATPFSRTVIIGSSNSVSAASPQSLSGSSFEFASWSDGGARSHTIMAPAASASYSATYFLVSGGTSWAETDVGAVGIPGGSSISSGTFTVDGSGADIYGSSDQFHFVYQQLTGDAEITARVASVELTQTYAKSGVMFRQDLTNNSPHAMMLIEPSKVTAFMWRLTKGATTSSVGSPGSAPYWVRLARSGNDFTAYKSADGTNWVPVGVTTTVNLPSTVYVGLAVTSHDNTQLCTAVFDNVTIAVPVAPTPTPTGTPPPTPTPTRTATPTPSATPTGTSTFTPSRTPTRTPTPLPSADLSIVKTGSTGSGHAMTFTLRVSNAGPNAAQGVAVADVLSSRLTYQSASTTKGTCSFSAATRAVNCAVGSLAVGEAFTVTIQTVSSGTSKIANTGSVSASSPDPNSGNNSSHINLRPR